MIEPGTKLSDLLLYFSAFSASYLASFYNAAFLFLNWSNSSGTFSSYFGFLLLTTSFYNWVFSYSSFFVLSFSWLFFDFVFSIAVSVDFIFVETYFDYFWATYNSFSIISLFFLAYSTSFFNAVRSGSERTSELLSVLFTELSSAWSLFSSCLRLSSWFSRFLCCSSFSFNLAELFPPEVAASLDVKELMLDFAWSTLALV